MRGVLAHEFAHIKNRDILVSSVAAMIAGAISAIAQHLQFSSLFGGDDEDNPLGCIGALVMIVSRRSPRRCSSSRSRGSASTSPMRPARACSGPASRSPTRSRRSSAGAQAIPMKVNPATASLYIVNPLRAQGDRDALLDAPAARGADPPAARVRRGPGHPLRLVALARTRAAPPKKCRWRRRRTLSTRSSTSSSPWSERELPERERTKHVHRLHPYLGKFIPQLVEVLLARYVAAGRARARPVRGLGHDARAGARERVTTRPASTSPPSTAC